MAGRVLTVGFLATAAAACITSPFGRKQLTLVPDGQMNDMGAEAFADLKRKTPIESDSGVNAYVKCVAQAILKQAHDPTGVKSWEIVVFRDKQVNAFALPGGKIGVFTGILPVAKTPGQLAAVLGHEVGHVTARHGNERVSQGQVASLGATGLELILTGGRKSLSTGQKLGLTAAMGAAQVGILLPYSRAHESEADHIGLELMADAGFDPREAVQLWKNMAKGAGGAPPEILSTHPSNQTRIDQLEEWLKDVTPRFDRAKAAGRIPQCRLAGMVFYG